MDKLIEQALLENKIVRYIPTFEKVLKTYKRLLDEAEQQVKTCNKPAVISACEHVNTEHQKLTCNVCLMCGEILETDI